MSAELLTDVEKLAIREHPGVWFDSFGFLEDREKTLRRADPANAIQCELFSIYHWCRANNVQCNIIGLKSRKEGLSTGATALGHHHLSNYTADGVVIGTDHETSDTLMRMLRRYADNDAFPWGTDFKWKPAENAGEYSHGSTVKRDTAIDPKAGRSSTIQVLIATEVAHWPAAGKRSADETMLSILNSMPDIPNILRVVDSTANGAGGFFYETYQGAVTFAEMRAGNRGNGWIRVFEPWHSSPLRKVTLDDSQRAAVRDTLTEREEAGMINFGWTEGQVAWRRETISAKCGNSELKFDQEYPESEEVAFQVSGSPRFDLVGCARLKKMAELNFHRGKIGTIEENISCQFIPNDKGWLWMIEAPRPGLGYCVIADVMTGEQSAGSKRRDCHAPAVLREGYLDGDKVWHPTALVAAIHVDDETEPGGCRWGLALLADRVRRLTILYGGAIVVPEANNPGLTLIELLKERGVQVWQRDDPDHMNLGKKLKKSGFRTDSKTKEAVVETLADMIESAGIEGKEQFVCHYPRASKEFATFVRLPDGKCEAAQGNHDDWVMAIGIGLTVNCFSAFPTPQRQQWQSNNDYHDSNPIAQRHGSGAVG